MVKDKVILFSDCIPVKGAKRSLLCDMQNNKFYYIPNSLVEILEAYRGKSLDYIKAQFEPNNHTIIDEYFQFLESNNLIFFTSRPELFPLMSLEWKSPSLITNLIVDFDEKLHDFKNILQQLEHLKCSYVQLRFYKNVSTNYIKQILEYVEKIKSRVVSIDFIIPHTSSNSKKELNEILEQHPRVHALITYNSPRKISYPAIREKMGYLMLVKKNILNEKHCGIINEEYFYSNIKLFSESQKYNTCLNRKISIDKDGEIRNCPSMPKSFGNISSTSLFEALNKNDFKEYWQISKDQITICKDCEFRHVCTDCRAYIDNPSDIFSKPLKCGYNPYTNEWEEWSKNPCKQKAIKTYNLEAIVEKNV